MKVLIYICILLVTGAIAVKFNINYTEKFKNDRGKSFFIAPPKEMQYMAFGYNDSFADSMWLRWLQEPEACGKDRILRTTFEKNYAGFKKEGSMQHDLDLGYDRNVKHVCDKGWSFLILDSISNLAPQWREPYFRGALLLSVIVDDHEGAKILFEKGTKHFPNDWKLLYMAGYHYLFELDDLPKAAEYLVRAGDHGAPYWVQSLAAKLYTKAGQLLLGISTLENYLDDQVKIGLKPEDKYYIATMKKIKKMRAQLKAQKKAPNSNN